MRVCVLLARAQRTFDRACARAEACATGAAACAAVIVSGACAFAALPVLRRSASLGVADDAFAHKLLGFGVVNGFSLAFAVHQMSRLI